MRGPRGGRAGAYYNGGCSCLVQSAAAIGDLDGDGRAELVAGVSPDEAAGVAVLLQGRDAPSSGPRYGPIRRALTRQIADDGLYGVGDVDGGDGRGDLAVTRPSGATTILHLGADRRTRASTRLHLPPGFTVRRVSGVGDLDGDAAPDLRVDYANRSASVSAIVYGPIQPGTIDLAGDPGRVLRIG